MVVGLLWERLAEVVMGLESLRVATDGLLVAPDVVDSRVLPRVVVGVWVDGGEVACEEYRKLYALVAFEGCVLDGGRIVLREWESLTG